MAGIFISYRREDTGMVAKDIEQRLREQLVKADVFFDMRSIGAGDAFQRVGSATGAGFYSANSVATLSTEGMVRIQERLVNRVNQSPNWTPKLSTF